MYCLNQKTMKSIDTRELQERLEELESLECDLEIAKDTLQDARDALEEYEHMESYCEGDDGHRELENEVAEAEEEVNDIDFDETDLEELRDLKAEIGDEWDYGVQLIPIDEFTEYCKEMLEDCGDIPKNLPGYIAIDWDQTAENLKPDYSEVVYNGEAYYHRT